VRVARTIADLDQSESIREEHVLEALSYREVERILSTFSAGEGCFARPVSVIQRCD
jgi:hypothetical protein